MWRPQWMFGGGESQIEPATLADVEKAQKLDKEKAREVLREKRRAYANKMCALEPDLALRFCLRQAGLPGNIQNVLGRSYRFDSKARGTGAPCWRHIMYGTVRSVSLQNGYVLELGLDQELFGGNAFKGHETSVLRFDCYDHLHGEGEKLGWHGLWMKMSYPDEPSYVTDLSFFLL